MAHASADRSQAAAFADAERHSRLVRTLRILVPASAVAAVIATVVTAALQPLSSEVHVDIAGIDVGGSTVAMDAPNLKGFNSQDRAYEVTAKTARQKIASPNEIGLEGLSARMELAAQGWAVLSSDFGQYDTEAQVLNLSKSVRVISDKGDDAALDSARAELKSGRIVSDKPVAIKLGNSRLTAERMEVLDSGDHVRFHGKVRLTLQRGGNPDPARSEIRSSQP